MLRFISVLLFSLLSVTAQDYFPLVAGSQWVYRGSFASESLTLKLGAERQINGRTYIELTGYAAQPLLVRQSEPGIYVYWDESTKQDALLINFDGAEYTSPSSDCQQQGKANGRSVKYEGPLGAFDTAREVQFFGGICADTGTTREVYLAGAGMLRRSVTSFTGERHFDLIYAQIGGITYLSDTQVSFGISLTQLAPIQDATQLAARLVLTNRSGEDIVLDFPSGQRFDFQIKDARGEVVFTWSATRIFLQANGQVVVKDEAVWADTFAVGALRPGTYSLEGFLTNSDGKRFSATAAFSKK